MRRLHGAESRSNNPKVGLLLDVLGSFLRTCVVVIFLEGLGIGGKSPRIPAFISFP